MEQGRSKRRSALRKTNMPSAAHYVGYVEEDETPEMIMKKFEELEKIMGGSKPAASPVEATAAAGADTLVPSSSQGLNDAQLDEIFKATSIFSVKAIMSGNEALMLKQQHAALGTCSDSGQMTDSDEECMVDELKGFWSDEDWDTIKKSKRRGKRREAGAEPPAPARSRPPRLPSSSARTAYVTHFNPDTQAFIRRKVRLPDQDAITHLRIPGPPLPASWGRAVAPLAPPGVAEGAAVFTARDVAAFPFTTLPQQQYLAVLVNRGWLEQPVPAPPHELGQDNHSHLQHHHHHHHHQQQQQQKQRAPARSAAAGAAPGRRRGRGSTPAPTGGTDQEALDPVAAAVRARLAVLPWQQLVPRGFVFIWLKKEDISAVVRCMADAGYTYVENLTWVLLGANHNVLRLPSPLSCQSHLSLYIFRREGEGRDIELRHQRNPDVVFDCVATPDGRNWATPREVLSIIETLLPTGMGSFLELWAPQGPSRPGWTHLCQEAPPQPPPTHNQQQQGDEQQQQQQQQMQQQEAAHHMEALQPAA